MKLSAAERSNRFSKVVTFWYALIYYLFKTKA